MILLATGSPGAGKTSNILWHYYNLLKKDPVFKHVDEETGEVQEVERQIYTFNVNGIDYEKTGFKPCEDPTKWMDLPVGSTLIIDETPDLDDLGFEDFASNKKTAAQLSEHIKLLRRHRHFGVDIVFITQHPSLVNKGIRIMLNEHWHYFRPFNLTKTTLFKNNRLMDVDKPGLAFSKRSGTLKSRVKLPKEVFSMYKSTQLDTMTKGIPKAFILVPLVLLALLGGCIYLFMNTFSNFTGKNEEIEEDNNGFSLVPKPNTSNNVNKSSISEDIDTDENRVINRFSKEKEELPNAKDIQEMMTPRIVGRPETAPFYDSVYLGNVQSYPRIAGCMSIQEENRCVCHTQQGTIYQTTKSFCKNWLNGYKPFNPTIPDNTDTFQYQ